MSKMSGYLVSELVTAVLVVAVLLAVAFGVYVSSQRDSMVERAQQSLAELKERVATTSDLRQPIACDDSLVEPKLLDNDYISLTLKPISMKTSDTGRGYGAGVHIHSKKKEDSDDTFVTSVRLFEAIKEQNEKSLRLIQKKKDEIEYFVLVSDTAVCEKPVRT